jgi:hypothetical protein
LGFLGWCEWWWVAFFADVGGFLFGPIVTALLAGGGEDGTEGRSRGCRAVTPIDRVGDTLGVDRRSADEGVLVGVWRETTSRQVDDRSSA